MKIAVIGGHFTPALAVIEQLPKSTEIIYVGRKYTFEKDTSISLEYRTMQERGIPFVALKTGRLQRSFSPQTIPSLFKIPAGLLQAREILKQQKPDVVIGFGGYLSLPVCLAAYTMRIPFVIHEQTLNAGMSNKILGRFATTVCISWNSSAQFFPQEKTVLTGNPLPESMFTFSKFVNVHHDNKTICIVGGSAGSHALNVLVEGCLKQLLEQYHIIHQTGDAQEFGDYARLETLRQSLPDRLQRRYTLTKFIQPEKFIATVQSADLVVSRSGINTVTALLLLKKPSLLVPLPVGQQNEQYENAKLLCAYGLGEIVMQEKLTSEILFDKIQFILDNREKYQYVSQKKEEETNPLHAAEKIVTILNNIAQR